MEYIAILDFLKFWKRFDELVTNCSHYLTNELNCQVSVFFVWIQISSSNTFVTRPSIRHFRQNNFLIVVTQPNLPTALTLKLVHPGLPRCAQISLFYNISIIELASNISRLCRSRRIANCERGSNYDYFRFTRKSHFRRHIWHNRKKDDYCYNR